MLSKESLDVVVPLYNEEGCIFELLRRLESLRAALVDSVDVSFIVVNDGSTDKSLEQLLEAAQLTPYLKIVDLSRNFGHQIALTAGVDTSTAKWVATIDGDLQDPPELIAEMLNVARTGYDVVYAKRKRREGETWFKLATATAFYRLINRLCEIDIPRDTGDFRLMSRKAVDALNQMRETHRFIRGMVPWVGFKTYCYEYMRDARHAGETKYPLRKMIRFALDAVFSFSRTPLKLMRYGGMLVTVAGFVGGFYVLYLKLFTDKVLPGVTASVLTTIILGGVQILSLGIVGEYVGRIFEESKRRPLYFINEKINF